MNRNARHLHIQITDILVDRIHSSFYKPSDQFPTETQLSTEFGVSRGTMRKAMQLLESQGLVTRIAGKGTFINTSDELPIYSKEPANLIGIAIHDRLEQLNSDILRGVERVIREKGYGLVYTNIEDNTIEERKQLLRLKAQKVAGIILNTLAVPGEAQMLSSLLVSTPVVLVDRELPEFSHNIVMADHFHGALDAVNHLLGLGHQKIAFITYPSFASSVSDRQRAYEQAMRDANLLPYAPIPIFVKRHPAGVLPIYSPEEMRWVDHMLSVADRPTAVFCVNDHLATGVMRLAMAKGLNVPDDLAIIGFDNFQFAQLTPVPLSSIDQNAEEIGVKAAELLLRRIADPNEQDQRILIPTRLVVRQSTLANLK